MMPFVTYPTVVPSGRAFTTWDVPMLPPAPGRLKITTSWSVSEKGWIPCARGCPRRRPAERDDHRHLRRLRKEGAWCRSCGEKSACELKKSASFHGLLRLNASNGTGLVPMYRMIQIRRENSNDGKTSCRPWLRRRRICRLCGRNA